MVKHNALILPSGITLYYARNMQYRVIRAICQVRVKCGQIYKICTFYALQCLIFVELRTIRRSAPVSDSQLQIQIESGARGVTFVYK